MIDLKPCPFCGERATFELVTAEMHNGVSEYRLMVKCGNCEIHSGKSYVVRKKFQNGTFITIEDERDKAVEEWNRRVNDATD